jgi:hypothetical protein
MGKNGKHIMTERIMLEAGISYDDVNMIPKKGKFTWAFLPLINFPKDQMCFLFSQMKDEWKKGQGKEIF